MKWIIKNAPTLVLAGFGILGGTTAGVFKTWPLTALGIILFSTILGTVITLKVKAADTGGWFKGLETYFTAGALMGTFSLGYAVVNMLNHLAGLTH